MTIKIISFATLLAYSFIVSQSFMYILALKNVQLTLGASAYTEFCQLIDAGMRSTFKYVLYAALLTNLLLVIATSKNPGGVLFITAAIALIALAIDIVLTVKGSLPVNDIINQWSADNYPANWTCYREKWFTIFQYRQVANITGL